MQYLKFILWQNTHKPETKGEYFLTAITWILVMILLLIFAGFILTADLPLLLKGIALVYLLPNILFYGVSRNIAQEQGFFNIYMFQFLLSIFFSVFYVYFYTKNHEEA